MWPWPSSNGRRRGREGAEGSCSRSGWRPALAECASKQERLDVGKSLTEVTRIAFEDRVARHERRARRLPPKLIARLAQGVTLGVPLHARTYATEADALEQRQAARDPGDRRVAPAPLSPTRPDVALGVSDEEACPWHIASRNRQNAAPRRADFAALVGSGRRPGHAPQPCASPLPSGSTAPWFGAGCGTARACPPLNHEPVTS
jgi:hypothetical protein